MTILLTEIHPFEPTPYILFGSDGRISRNGKAAGVASKLLLLQRLRAAIGYFGLAEVGNKAMYQWLSEWCTKSQSNDMASFADDLARELNRTVPEEIRRSYISGFHISGFGKNNEPEFWFVRNVEDDRTTIKPIYSAREDFKRQHRELLIKGQHQIYRNGDIRAHVIAWERLDKALAPLLTFPDFKAITMPEDYGRWTKFKLQIVASFYRRFCHQSIIGSPIEVLLLKPGCAPSWI